MKTPAPPRRGKRIAAVALGAAAGQAAVVLVSPLVSRLYTPGEIGLLGAYQSLLGITLVAASLRYDRAILLPETDREARAVAALSLGCVAASTFLAMLLVPLVGHRVGALLEAPELAEYLWLFPVGLLTAGTAQVVTQWAIRRSEFGRIGISRVLDGGGKASAQVGLGLMMGGSLALLVADLLGRVAGAAVLLAGRTSGLFARVGGVIAGQARRYWKFAALSTPSGLLNVAGLRLPTMVIAALYGLEAAGFYELAMRVVTAPAFLISQAVGQVYLSEAAALRRTRPERLASLFLAHSRRLAVLGGLATPVLVVVAPALFTGVFGEQWTEAGSLVRILAVMTLAQFVAVPLSQTLVVLERQGFQLLWDAARLAGAVGVPIAVALTGADLETTVAWLSGSMTAAYAALWLAGLRAVLEEKKRATNGRSLPEGS